MRQLFWSWQGITVSASLCISVCYVRQCTPWFQRNDRAHWQASNMRWYIFSFHQIWIQFRQLTPKSSFGFHFEFITRESAKESSYGYENGEMRAVTFIIYITFYCRFTLSLACIFGEKSSSGIIIMIFLCFRIKLYHWVNHQIRKKMFFL